MPIMQKILQISFGIDFPFVKHEKYDKNFDPEVYMQSGFCQTINFNCTQEQAEKVVGLMEYNVIGLEKEIIGLL